MDPKYTIPGTIENNLVWIGVALYVLLWIWAWPVALLGTFGYIIYKDHQANSRDFTRRDK